MFGFGKKRKHEQAIERVLEVVHHELSQHVSMAADAYGVQWALVVPTHSQERYMAILFVFALSYGETIPAEPEAARRAFINFYNRFFPDQRNVQDRTLQALRDHDSSNAFEATSYVCRKFVAGVSPEEREHLYAGLAQIYLGVA